MTRPPIFMGAALAVTVAALLLSLSTGASALAPAQVIGALTAFDADSYDHYVVVYQRLPRALIAIYVGSLMACAGAVLQGLTRNPLASPATLGVNAGATLFVVGGAYLFHFGPSAQGAAALMGGTLGFAGSLFLARFTGLARDPRGLSLILSGALVSMLLLGIANAFLLADPARRTDFLGWITGNINHVYAERLYDVWWIGALSLAALLFLARPLTLISLGIDKAASAGVPVFWVRRGAFAAVMLGASSAVAICGPVGFVGLVVPHIVRPFVGSAMRWLLPASALVGASLCLLADVVARRAFAPFTLHTGVVMDLLGGVAFALIVHRVYLAPRRGRAAEGTP